MPGISRRPSISASNSPPGTGISSTWCGCSCSSASMSGATARKPWPTARIDLKTTVLQGGGHRAALFVWPGAKDQSDARPDTADIDRERDARACLQVPAVRPRPALWRIPHPAAGLRSLRAGLRLHRYRRRARGLHHHGGRRDRGQLRPDRRDKIPAAVLAARGAVAAADPRDHAVAAAFDEVAFDRAAVPSQGRRRSVDRSRAEMTGMIRRRGIGFGVFTLSMVAVFAGLGIWQLQRRAE